MPTITAPGFADIEPQLVLEYAATRPTRTIVHDTIDPDSGAPYITLLAAGPRRGKLTLLFDNQDDAMTCFNRHGLRLVFTFSHELRHTWAMRYVAVDDLGIELDDDAKHFTVTIPFQEVPA